jgi:uncharacterized membrane protein YqjE
LAANSVNASEKPGGIIGNLRALLCSGLEAAQARLELFSVELQEEKCRLIQSFLLAATCAAFGIISLTLLTLAVVLLFRPEYRPWAVLILALLYAGVSFFLWRYLCAQIKAQLPLEASISELGKDKQWVRDFSD